MKKIFFIYFLLSIGLSGQHTTCQPDGSFFHSWFNHRTIIQAAVITSPIAYSCLLNSIDNTASMPISHRILVQQYRSFVCSITSQFLVSIFSTTQIQKRLEQKEQKGAKLWYAAPAITTFTIGLADHILRPEKAYFYSVTIPLSVGLALHGYMSYKQEINVDKRMAPYDNLVKQSLNLIT